MYMQKGMPTGMTNSAAGETEARGTRTRSFGIGGRSVVRTRRPACCIISSAGAVSRSEDPKIVAYLSSPFEGVAFHGRRLAYCRVAELIFLGNWRIRSGLSDDDEGGSSFHDQKMIHHMRTRFGNRTPVTGGTIDVDLLLPILHR